MTHQVVSSAIAATAAVICAWMMIHWRGIERDLGTRRLAVIGAVLLLALAANETYRMVELISAQPAAVTQEVPTCAK